MKTDSDPTDLPPPWEWIHRDLTDSRLRRVAALIRNWRHTKLSNRLLPDEPWNLGCDCNRWVRYGIEDAARGEETNWLKVTQPSLEFVFQIGVVPFRFFRDGVPDQLARTLQQSDPELDAIQLAFPMLEKKPDQALRLAFTTDDLGEVTKVVLVQLSQDGDVLYQWPIPLDGDATVLMIDAGGPKGVDLGPVQAGLPEDEEARGEEDEEKRRGA